MGRRDAHLQIVPLRPSPRDVGATSHRLLAFPPAAEESAETRRRGFRAAGEDDGDERLCSLEALYFFAREFHEGGGR